LDVPAEEFAELTAIDPQQNRRFKGDKLSILDVKVKTQDGKMIDIEIQREHVKAMNERAVYLNARMLSDQLKRSQNYAKLKKVVSIVIADFDMVRNGAYHNRFFMHDPVTGSTLSDIMQIDVLSLPNVPDVDDKSSLWAWLRVIEGKDEKEMEEIAEKNPHIGKVVMRLAEMSEDEAEREMAFRQETFRRDMVARAEYVKDEARAEGLAEGLAEGRAEGRAENAEAVARRMKADDLAVEQIAKYTGLEIDEIERL
jgi:predicted transposase/invertase (TIGR01784 family)